MADYSDLFRQNPQLFAQVMASLSGAVGSSAGASSGPPVDAQQQPPPVEQPAAQVAPPPVQAPPVQAPPPPVQAPPVQAPPEERPATPWASYGALEPGNIDLTRRPHVQNEDGTVSTVRSMGVNVDGKEVLIPTVSDDGRIMSDDEAVQEYQRTGRHLGVYASPEASTAAAEAIHRDQETNMPANTLAPSEPSEPTGPIDMRVTPDVTQPKGSLAQQGAQLQAEDLTAANETATSFEREGDAKALAASEAAKIYGAQAGAADRYARAAETGFKDHQERAAKYRQMEDEDYARLQQEPPKPGHLKNIFNVITGIIGAAAGGEQGAAIGMLRQHVNRQAEEDAQERAAAERRIEVGGKIQDRILRDSANEFDAAAKLVAGQWIVASRQLEQIANESSVPAFKEQALRLSIQAKEQARGLLKHNVETQVQQAQAQAKARAASMRTKWDEMTQKDLEALQKAGLLPAPQAEKLAELQIKQRKASGEEDSAIARSNIKQEAAKSLRLYDSAERDAVVLRDTIKLLDKQGSNDVPGIGPVAGLVGDWLISPKGVRVRQATKKVLKAQLRDESGAAISDDELEAYMDDRGMGQNATNADFLAGARVALEEFEQKRAIARQAAGIGDGTPEQPEATDYAAFEASLGARTKGAP